MHTIISHQGPGIGLQAISDSGEATGELNVIEPSRLTSEIADHRSRLIRWTWDDTNNWYPALLTEGIRVDRSHDLRLAHVILRASALAADTTLAQAHSTVWDQLAPAPPPGGPTATMMTGPDRHAGSQPLFEMGEITTPAAHPAHRHTAHHHADRRGPDRKNGGVQGNGDEVEGDLDSARELTAQLDAIKNSTDPGRLRLLLAAESAGALAAAEMHHTGLPWRSDIHNEILTKALGPRPQPSARPVKLEELAHQIRYALDAPRTLNPDSHQDLLRAMQYAGVGARSLRKWELEKLDHPVITPLLAYKRLYRLFTANGWNWLDTWAPEGRFRMEYVVGGVVTGRWASTGGGALQLPHAVRRAVVADPDWTFVVADAAQLEPRILAALSRDDRMAAAGRGKNGANTDMYAGMVATGAVATRELAKVGMLGAMYGGTTGISAQVLPQLARAFPQAIDLVERAARAGEHGEVVSTWLGRSSPLPGKAWASVQGSAFEENAGAEVQSRARSQTKAWGRFTRNFVVQGTAAEWALCWIASIRRRLWELGEVSTGATNQASVDAMSPAPAPFNRRPHLVFFLHDEVVVHTPVAFAADVEEEVRAAADEAGQLLFGDFPVDFPLSVATTTQYADAKG